MRKMLEGLPIWPRMTLSGLFWGTVCGIGTAGSMLLMFITAESVGGEIGNIYYFVVALGVYLAIACTCGAVLGGVLGTATGMAAGVVLALIIGRFSTGVAVAVTVGVVVASQVAIGLSMPDLVGAWWIWPTLAVIPLTLTALGAARANQIEMAQRRDTLAA